MSRIGKLPVAIPKGVKTSLSGQTLQAEGPKGKLAMEINPAISVEVSESEIVCKMNNPEEPTSKPLYGLTRSLVNNLVIGVSTGFKKELEIQGTGYRAFLKGKELELNVGHSHPVLYPIPDGITINVEKNVKIAIEGADKQLVGQTAAEIRGFRKPEPYKGKGIKYADEVIRKKAGKTAAAGS